MSETAVSLALFLPVCLIVKDLQPTAEIPVNGSRKALESAACLTLRHGSQLLEARGSEGLADRL